MMPMHYDVQKYINGKGGKYLLVNSIARRVRSLQNGHKPLVARRFSKTEDLVMEEFRQGMIKVEPKIVATPGSLPEAGETGEAKA